MTDNKQTTTTVPNTSQRRPNETGSVSVQGHIRIRDPNTQQVFVEKRA